MPVGYKAYVNVLLCAEVGLVLPHSLTMFCSGPEHTGLEAEAFRKTPDLEASRRKEGNVLR